MEDLMTDITEDLLRAEIKYWKKAQDDELIALRARVDQLVAEKDAIHVSRMEYQEIALDANRRVAELEAALRDIATPEDRGGAWADEIKAIARATLNSS